MVKGGENQFSVLTDSPAHFQEKAKIFFLFNNCDYLQTGEFFFHMEIRGRIQKMQKNNFEH